MLACGIRTSWYVRSLQRSASHPLLLVRVRGTDAEREEGGPLVGRGRRPRHPRLPSHPRAFRFGAPGPADQALRLPRGRAREVLGAIDDRQGPPSSDLQSAHPMTLPPMCLLPPTSRLNYPRLGLEPGPPLHPPPLTFPPPFPTDTPARKRQPPLEHGGTRAAGT